MQSEVTTDDQHPRGTCRKCGFFTKACDDAEKVCCCHKTRVENIDPPLLPGTCVPGVSDVQQTPDREKIHSQLSCVSGPSALAAVSNAKETEGACFQDNVKDGPQEQRANETDERILLALKPSDRIFKSVYLKKWDLGSGSYGDVYVAIRKSDYQEVAVKSIKRRKNDIPITVAGYPKPVITEVAMMAMLQKPPTSPYVIEMFEWFDYPDKIEIVLEYPAPCLELRTLISLCHLNEQKVRNLMRQAVQAVKHCLDRGVFHNDIHTSNILVNTRTYQLKLIDFGCALVYEKGKLFPYHKYRGAKDYRPPEVNAKKDFEGEQTNVFQLGKLLEKMSPGCRPRLSDDCLKLSVECKTYLPSKRPKVDKLLEHKWFKYA